MSVSACRGLFGRRREKELCSFLPPKREEASSASHLRPLPHGRWFWRSALHCFLEFSERLPWHLALYFRQLGAPRQIPRTPKDVSAAVAEGVSRSRAWLGFKDRCPIVRVHRDFADDEQVMCFALHGCGKASPGSVLSSHLHSRR